MLLFGAWWLAACSLPADRPAGLLLTDHPLAGRIWDVQAGRFVGRDRLADAIVDADYLLLGETHDNPRHHQGQAWAIAQLGAGGRPAAVAFEMISRQQGQFIAGRRYDSAESLIAGLDHVQTRWQYRRLYTPVFAATIDAGYAVLPANFDRDDILRFARNGEDALPAEIRMLLERTPLPAGQVAASRKEIEQSHCGMISEQMTAAMMRVQRAKDAEMTRALLGAQTAGTRVLVAGSGHVRTDRGVPLYLRDQVADGAVLAVAWLEVQPGLGDVASYAGHWGDGRLPFDFVWFTPRVDRPDPCKRFEQHMKHGRSGAG